MPRYLITEIAKIIGADIIGSSQKEITGIGTIQDGVSGQIGFLAASSYFKYLADTSLSAVIVSQAYEQVPCTQLVVKNVKRAWRQVVELFAEQPVYSGIDEQAIVAVTAKIGDKVSIGAATTIGGNAEIGNGCIIGSGVNIGRNVKIGRDGYIANGVNILDGTIIGSNVFIESGAVIGSRGFGFSFEDNAWKQILQVGRVVIGDNVDIGANTTIDRGAVNDTVIGNGVKLDNLIQVGHNVVIGDHTIIAGCCVIAGSVTFGSYCMIGGASVFAGHIEICDHVQITGHSSLGKSIKKPGVYSSAFPAMPNKQWNRLVANVRQLDKKRSTKN